MLVDFLKLAGETAVQSDNEVKVGLIVAGAALLGSAVGLVGNIINNKHERKSKLVDYKIKKYEKYIETLQDIMNNPDEKEIFISYQTLTDVIILISNEQVASLVNQYYKEMVRKSNIGYYMPHTVHAKYQTDIINAMRKDVGFSSKKLKDASLIAMRTQNNTGANPSDKTP